MVYHLFLLAFLGSSFAFAKPSRVFEQALQKYQKAKMISMKVEKTVTSELLGKSTVHKGHIFLSSGRFRWENEEPEKTVLLFDGKILMNVQYPPKEFGGPVQVAKSKMNQKTKKQILISSLLSPRSAKEKFKILNEKKNGKLSEFELLPSGKDLQIKSLSLKIDPKDKSIQEIKYVDDVGNKTTLQFRQIKFLAKTDSSLFVYKIPKGAQVTDL